MLRKWVPLLAAVLVASVPAVVPAFGDAPAPPRGSAEAVGFGGAVSSVDADATAAGIEVLRHGGNAADAAVAVAAALGVTEPFSSGFGGGGFLVYYDARTGRVSTLDGRETAPAAADENLFVEDGRPVPFEEAVTSGLSVGVPGTPLTWQTALDRFGTRRLADVLRPAERLAERGFVVDDYFHTLVRENAARFAAFPATRELFLPHGRPPEVGSVLRNPDLARTYRLLGEHGPDVLYHGEIGRDVVRAVRQPPVDPAAGRTVRPGRMTEDDLHAYTVPFRAPTRVSYRGLDVYGMAPPSSGGTTVGEALNILERTDLTGLSRNEYLHRFLEASKLAFADRNRWVGDPDQVDVPTRELLSQRFADSRSCLVRADQVLPAPAAPADPRDPTPCGTSGAPVAKPDEGQSTTHLTVADRWGNVAAYTLTIEQTGGSGIVVPGRGFLLNNELTDFDFTPLTPGVPDPNLPGPGKRPRSSMSPTIVLAQGRPVLAVGSPGGATIITTVLQVLTGRLDRGLSLVDAIAEPRASQRNTEVTEAEPAFGGQGERTALEGWGHRFKPRASIGLATGVERLPDGRWVAAAERVRGGGGAAAVVRPARPGE
ncbi:gamma-glutamyltranspeptidase / glutathione hydrolase [Streptoalloteichus tenebrarius]|uniref:Glutathione hydrolase proenzyme n=1 Tax=Streptoalloteichus tenebrarius (strain ATCC 17920 / DSM 40477 / JCM 4838 / CBS 697.72 / NBRC 16177 / NCIMB 11028 / NRRL B-12390 / A12253. 1 / ISP 5477) TaxID=1933 RepID=A0ABT1HZY5_STRSD|nr:gamma-glutamyltransferase [Streptoalloteichus tenebrarius]MCP2261096.1 gamma-glutamyltranspeptidase / glutathione hydrolase [Streptoalloteichus tenebrarius]BFF03996.1 gamma-glutamyltransferase [Streptoalloteichus tenebrarius]